MALSCHSSRMNASTLETLILKLRRKGANSFQKEKHGKILISFSCVEADGRRYAYFYDNGEIARHLDITDELIEKLSGK
jgi:hypothetical protein